MKKPIKFIIPKSTYIPVHLDNKKKVKKSCIECQKYFNKKNKNENEKNKNENEKNKNENKQIRKTENIIVQPVVNVINDVPSSQYGYSWIPSEIYNYGCTFPNQYCPLTNYTGPSIYSGPCQPSCYQPNCYQPNCYQPNCYQPNCYQPNCYQPNCYQPNYCHPPYSNQYFNPYI